MRVEEVEAAELVDRDEAIRHLKGHLQRAHQQMNRYADKKQGHHCFEVGVGIFEVVASETLQK